MTKREYRYHKRKRFKKETWFLNSGCIMRENGNHTDIDMTKYFTLPKTGKDYFTNRMNKF